MILNDKNKTNVFVSAPEYEWEDIPGPQQMPFAAHRPLGTIEQVAALIEHGMTLRFSVEHWRMSAGCPIRQPRPVQQIDGP